MFEDEDQESAKLLRPPEQFIQAVKSQQLLKQNFLNMLLEVPIRFLDWNN